jgi:alanine dehydrogenase
MKESDNMKLAKELIKLMSDYYSLNNLNIKMKSPINQEYLEILKPDIIRTYLNPFGYVIEPEP